MLYKLAHIIRDRLPWLWDFIGIFNSLLFMLRYKKYKHDVDTIVERYSKGNVIDGKQLHFEILNKDNIAPLSRMFAEQPAEAFTYFKPHKFDQPSLAKLAKDNGFLAFIVKADERVIGYIFQRSFFWGKSFRGYMTDYRWQRKGINKLMNQFANELSVLLGLNVYGTISPKNVSSMKSAQSANDLKIIERLDNGDYYVQYLPKKS